MRYFRKRSWGYFLVRCVGYMCPWMRTGRQPDRRRPLCWQLDSSAGDWLEARCTLPMIHCLLAVTASTWPDAGQAVHRVSGLCACALWSFQARGPIKALARCRDASRRHFLVIDLAASFVCNSIRIHYVRRYHWIIILSSFKKMWMCPQP